MNGRQVRIALQAILLSMCLLAAPAYAAEGGGATASITFVKEQQDSRPPSSSSRPKRRGSSRDMQDKDIYNSGQGISPDTDPDSGNSTVKIVDPMVPLGNLLGNLPETGHRGIGPNCL